MENPQQPPPSQAPKWLTDGLLRQESAPQAPYIPDRVTIDIWDACPPWTQDDIFSVVVCVDGEVIGKPLSKEDGCTVVNWLQEAFPQIEKMILDEVERLYEEEEKTAS